MYTLVLTFILIASHSSDSAVSIEHIDGFDSLERCQLAGNAWIAQQKTIRPSYVTVMPKALCVRKSN